MTIHLTRYGISDKMHCGFWHSIMAWWTPRATRKKTQKHPKYFKNVSWVIFPMASILPHWQKYFTNKALINSAFIYIFRLWAHLLIQAWSDPLASIQPKPVIHLISSRIFETYPTLNFNFISIRPTDLARIYDARKFDIERLYLVHHYV